MRVGDAEIDLGTVDRLIVVGAGKATLAMARGLEEVLGLELLQAKQVSGRINVPRSQTASLIRVVPQAARASHENEPTREGVLGARKMMELVSGLSSRDLVICLLSGGGSALWPLPANGVGLGAKKKITRLLHDAGATINEMNAVRKHLSRIKGGGLVRATRARIISLVVSDVVGDPLDVIGSGPTAPDPTTYSDALDVLHKYRLLQRAPRSVVEHLWAGARGEHPETWKRTSSRVRNVVIGNNNLALRAAEKEARKRGYRTVNLSSFLEGESREVGIVLAGMARGVRNRGVPAPAPGCLLSGGETTVSLGRRHGRGGRNQELVLGALVYLGEAGATGISILSGGTDGEDGPTDAAGAVADATVARRARRLGLDPREFLERHDSYSFFERAGGLLRTGPTHTNVMDLRVVLVG